jgi:hypothetical protein
MELVIPVIALGALYSLSKEPQQQQQPTKEYPTKEQQQQQQQQQQLQQLQQLQQPQQQIKEKQPAPYSGSNYAKYNGGENATGAMFKPQQESFGPSGKDYSHQNMQPHFGSRERTLYSVEGASEGIFDHYSGAGSTQITKSSQAPAFSPASNLQNPYGMPNNNDFYQDYVKTTASTRMNGVKLTEVNEGRGLGGGATYQSALDSRDTYMPKGIDDMRAINNPKSLETRLGGYEGAAHGYANERVEHAPVHKNRPDTFAEIGPERWFTTMGQETAPAARSMQIDRFTNRTNTDYQSEYTGAAGSVMPSQGAYLIEREFAPTFRQELGDLPIGIASAEGRSGGSTFDYNRKAMPVYNNGRSAAPQTTYFGSGFSDVIGAVVAPLLDALRPTRKQNTITNMRPYGSAKAPVIRSDYRSAGMYLEPTIRDQTHVENYIPGINATSVQRPDGYTIAQVQLRDNERDTTTDFEYTGAAASANMAPRLQENHNIRPDGNKLQTLAGRMVPGASNTFAGPSNAGSLTHRSSGYSEKSNNRATFSTSGLGGGMNAMPNASQIGAYNPRYAAVEEVGLSRNDPSLMTEAFRANPYVHQLRV